jgi:hypothetical protein
VFGTGLFGNQACEALHNSGCVSMCKKGKGTNVCVYTSVCVSGCVTISKSCTFRQAQLKEEKQGLYSGASKCRAYGRPREKLTPLQAKLSHLTLRKHTSAPTPPFRDLRHALDS